MWPSLSYNLPSPREEVLINVDNDVPYSSYIMKRWKYINGTTSDGIFDGWLSEDYNRTERDETLTNYGKAVASSPVGRALSTFSSTNVDESMHSEIPGLRRQPMPHKAIESIRKQSQFTCNGVPHQNDDSKYMCSPLQSACLFDIQTDPCERRNIITDHPILATILEYRVRHFMNIARAPRNGIPDPCSNPRFYNETWVSWYDLPKPEACF